MKPGQKRLLILFYNHLCQPWVAATIFIGWFLWHSPLQHQFDSEQLYLGCRDILSWLQSQSRTIGSPRPFPLFQYLSGVPAHWLESRGLPINIYSFWSTCSLLSLGGIIVVFHRAARRINLPAAGWASMAIMLSGPLLMYANSTFNEMIAALLILLFTDAVMNLRSPIGCAVFFLLSGITKEVAPIPLSVIWLGALWMRRSNLSRRQFFTQGMALLVAGTSTVAANAGFNVLRYGTIWNLEYIKGECLIGSPIWRLHYCIALWISPNGGMVEFWITLIAFTIAVVGIALRKGEGLAPVLLVGTLLGGITIGLSGWYQPFGWYAWGPRLLLPWMPASLLILMEGYPLATRTLTDRCVSSRIVAGTCIAILCLCALPHILATQQPAFVVPFFGNDARFPHGARVENQEQEYAQNLYFAWEKMPPMLVRPLLISSSLQFALAACFIFALMAILNECRRIHLHGSLSKGRKEK